MRTSAAAKCFLRAKADRSPRTLEQYVGALDHLTRECPDMPATPDPVRRALNKAPTIWVKDSWWRCWHAFFRWSALEWDIDNPMDRVARPRVPEVEMRYSPPDELVRLFAAARTVNEKAVLALALDAGVRASEFGRIRVMDISADTIRLRGGRRRSASRVTCRLVCLGQLTRWTWAKWQYPDS